MTQEVKRGAHNPDIFDRPLADVPIKRIAWAFGCAKKDSIEETALYRLLLAKVEAIREERIRRGDKT